MDIWRGIVKAEEITMTRSEWMPTMEQIRAIDEATFAEARKYLAECKKQERLVDERHIREIHHKADWEKCRLTAHKIVLEYLLQWETEGGLCMPWEDWAKFKQEVGLEQDLRLRRGALLHKGSLLQK